MTQFHFRMSFVKHNSDGSRTSHTYECVEDCLVCAVATLVQHLMDDYGITASDIVDITIVNCGQVHEAEVVIVVE